MPEITLSAIEQLLDKQLKPINTVMASLATSEELTEIKTTLAGVVTTVGGHTTLLDGIAKDVKNLLDEKTIAAARLDRLERWAQQVGEKIGVKLDLQTLVP